MDNLYIAHIFCIMFVSILIIARCIFSIVSNHSHKDRFKMRTHIRISIAPKRKSMSTVSIIIIGDEILSGKFADENTPFLIRRCRELNLQIQSIRVIPDALDRIAEAVREESQRSRYVFTTGGIGPTHDDKTFEGIALAFTEERHIHPVLLTYMNRYPDKVHEKTIDAIHHMINVPVSTILLESNPRYPVLQVHNVFIFPGVPKLMKMQFNSIADMFEGTAIIRLQIAMNTQETTIATQLANIQDKFPNISIGSYPRFDEIPSLIITVDGRCLEELDTVCSVIRNTFTCYLHEEST